MLIDGAGGGVASVARNYTGPSTTRDPAVEARLATVTAAARNGEDSVIYHISTALQEGGFTAAQKDEFVARLLEVAGDRNQEVAGYHIVGALETIGATTGMSAATRDTITASIASEVANGRLDADDLSVLFRPDFNTHSDGTRQLLTQVDDGAVLGQVAYTLYGESRRGGFDAGNEGQVAMLTSAADLAGMAADHGYPYAANGVTAFVADNPAALQASREIEWNVNHGAAAGRGSMDAFASALAGTRNSLTFADGSGPQDKFDQVFSMLVEIGPRPDGSPGQIEAGTVANDLGDYFANNIERLNDRTTVAGSWNDGAEGALPTTYQSLTERFVRNVMLDESFTNSRASDAIAGEMVRLGNIVTAPADQYAPNAAERLEAARELGTLYGSVQGAANDYVTDATGDRKAQADGIRSITDLLTGKALKGAGPVGDIVGGAVVDDFWDRVVADATADAVDRADDATGVLDDLGNSLDAAIKQGLSRAFPASTSDQTGVDYGDILDAYDGAAELHRN